jgi:hypothetical protein
VADDDGFLGRWSRRKQAEKERAANPAAAPAVPEAPAEKSEAATPPAAPEPVDLTKLPPIDSLTADSDYTAFLRPGVPQSMQIAALRRLWLTDPSVQNYEALVDYAWDFNAPGYGKLLPTDDVEKLLKQILGEPQAEDGREEPPPANVSEPPKIAVQNDAVRRSEERVATTVSLPSYDTAKAAEAPVSAADTTESDAAPRRRHGAALPKLSDEHEKG